MKFKSTGNRITTELLDKINTEKTSYKTRPMFSLLDFKVSKTPGYYWLEVVVSGDTEGRLIEVYQLSGKPVVLEKITELLYRYIDPQDEQKEVRYFETAVAVSEIEVKKKQVSVTTIPDIYYLTSAIYPINVIESFKLTGVSEISGRIRPSTDLGLQSYNKDDVSNEFKSVSGFLKVSLIVNSMLPESYSNTVKGMSGFLREVLLKYNYYQPEKVAATFKKVSGVLRTVLLKYSFYKPEETKVAAKEITGSAFQYQRTHEVFINADAEDYVGSAAPLQVMRSMFLSTTEPTAFAEVVDQGIVLNFKDLLSIVDSHNIILDFNPAPKTIWVLNPEFNLKNNIYTYSAYKTGGNVKYFSHANTDLAAGVVRSFKDVNMQQWQAFKDACNELTGVTDWVLDPANNQITYENPIGTITPKDQYIIDAYNPNTSAVVKFGNAQAACDYWNSNFSIPISALEGIQFSPSQARCNVGSTNYVTFSSRTNPDYDPNAVSGQNIVSFETISQKIISNASVVNQSTSLLAQAYLQEVANSVFNDKKYLILDDLVPTFELNKTLIHYGKTKEDNVKILSKTTSALDFENGLVDRIPSVVWESSGTAGVTSNKIFGNSSFETKALGDSLYTNSPIITGGSTPFTIEFYALIKGRYGWDIPAYTYYSLFSKATDSGAGEQIFLLNAANGGKLRIERQSSVGSPIDGIGSVNVKLNEINKYTFSYDGSAIRAFINDKLDCVIGTQQGFYSNTTEPFRFLRNIVPSATSYSHGALGLLDNINIHDGIATKVRNPDPYEEFLIVDLAFDGENNSTRIIDNGTEGSVWVVGPSTVLSTVKKFDGFSSLESQTNKYVMTTKNINFGFEDFTLSLKSLSIYSIASYILDQRSSISSYDGMCIGVSQGANALLTIYLPNSSKTGWAFTLKTLSQFTVNKECTLNLVRAGEFLKVYLNGLLINSFNIGNYVFPPSTSNSLIIGNSKQLSQGFVGYLKDFKIYKGVAIIPENPSGKIQLDFDNNVIDKYNNSKWTMTSQGLYDQVNSVKGSSVLLANAAEISSGVNSNLDYENKNFQYSLDYKARTLVGPYGAGIFSNNYNSNQENPDRHALVQSIANGHMYATSGTTNGLITNNTFYNVMQGRQGGIVYAKTNGVVTGVKNVLPATTFNYNYGGNTFLGKAAYFYSLITDAYIDNFKSIKDYKEEVIIDRPAVHLPLETNTINTGFASLTINSVGNPTYTTIDGKKCIKFESGKYLTIDSNNIFNLGTSSDFYMEFDFFVSDTSTGGISSNGVGYGGAPRDGTRYLYRSGLNIIFQYNNPNNTPFKLVSSEFKLNEFNNCKFYRKDITSSIEINGIIVSSEVTFDIHLSTNVMDLGYAFNSFNGYMSNFKMFVGTSTIPETYNDKKVLELDFKPTRESYLFKDNNNKCVIHPVNITQRDYVDGQYACTFNGTNQYIELGKNELFNFGYDDFIMEFKFRVIADNTWNILLGNGSTSSDNTYCYLGISPSEQPINKSLVYIACENVALPTSNEVSYTDINHLVISRNGTVVTMNLNGIETVHDRPQLLATFNANGSTRIGTTSRDNYIEHLFKGTIYSIKVFRNTSDLSLLDDEVIIEPEEPVEIPLSLTINPYSNSIKPVPGQIINLTGNIRNATVLPTLDVLVGSTIINQESISITQNGVGSYTYNIAVLVGDLTDDVLVTVTATSGADSATATTTLKIVKEYELKTNALDSFGNSWYQANPDNLVLLKKSTNKTAMYFNGLNGLYASSNMYRLGLSKFTIECEITTESLSSMHIISYGRSYNLESWYYLGVTNTGAVTFCYNKSTGAAITTPTGLVIQNKPVTISVTRDSDYILRIFVDGVKSAEAMVDTNFDSYSNNGGATYEPFTKYLYIGRDSAHYNQFSDVSKGFKGSIDNFNFNAGVCKYVDNYTTTVDSSKKTTTKCLLNVSNATGNLPTTIQDSYDSSLVWTNTGCKVSNTIDQLRPYSVEYTTVSNKLVSNNKDTFYLDKSNFTIDLVFKTNQVNAAATLLDMRFSADSFKGLYISQPTTNPASIRVAMGSKTASTAYEYDFNTGVNSVLINKTYHLRIVKDTNQVFVFLDGVLRQKTNTTWDNVETSTFATLGNDSVGSRGFNGFINQFRLIKGTASDAYAFEKITKELK